MLDQQDGGETAAKQRRAIADWLRRKGKQLPAKVLDHTRADPHVHADLVPVWVAFWQLIGSRSVGVAAGAIPWSELSCWCRDHEIHGQDLRRWCRLLSAMDSTYLAHLNKRKESGYDDDSARSRDRFGASKAGRGRD